MKSDHYPEWQLCWQSQPHRHPSIWDRSWTWVGGARLGSEKGTQAPSTQSPCYPLSPPLPSLGVLDSLSLSLEHPTKDSRRTQRCLTEGNTPVVPLGEKELGVGLITSGEDVRMGKLLSQSGLLFPFHQVASILLALRLRVRCAGEKKRWYSVRNDHWLLPPQPPPSISGPQKCHPGCQPTG